MTKENNFSFKLSDDIIADAARETTLWSDERINEISKLKVQEEFRREFLGNLAHELKIVVFNASDFIWAETHAKEVSDVCRLFLQPEWDKSAKMLPQIIDYIKENPVWSVSLQTHKYLDIP
jgi:organic radical activating enzyme